MDVVLLDRDGVINDFVWRPIKEGIGWGSPLYCDDVQLLPTVIDGIRELRQHDFYTAIVTNAMTSAHLRENTAGDVYAVHGKIVDLLARNLAPVDGSFLCTHRSRDLCVCRKPKLGLWQAFLATIAFQIDDLWMVGDADSDIEFGNNIGARTIRVHSKWSDANPSMLESEFDAANLFAAARIIIKETTR